MSSPDRSSDLSPDGSAEGSPAGFPDGSPGGRATGSPPPTGGAWPWGEDEPVRLGRDPARSRKVRSVYVHAPFCARRCFYCDFAVHVSKEGDAAGWVEALEGELAALEEEGLFVLGEELDTLYVGGGTPSLLGVGAMTALAELIGRSRLGGASLEWTAEANPESFTPEVAEGWRSAGVGRVSLGVQSFDGDALRWMGRLHGPEGAARAVRLAREVGFAEISVDLIFGLPERLDRSWRDDVARVLDLGVTHVSVYGLTVEEGTPLGRAVGGGRERVAPHEAYEEAYLEASRILSGAGFVHYEVSNFARPGSGSRHNRVYWSGAPYLGLGNSAHSYLHPIRRWNLPAWSAYRKRSREGRLPVADGEVLDDRAYRLERIWLGLRTRRGLDRSGWTEEARSLVGGWIERGAAESDGQVVRLTPRGWLTMDRLALDLDAFLGSTAAVGPGPASSVAPPTDRHPSSNDVAR